MLEVIEGLADDVIGVSAHGTIEADDYDSTLTPLIDAGVERHGKVALLVVLGPEFDGISAGAAWDDAKLGFSHATSFRRIAIVTDNQALRTAVSVLMYLVPGKSKGFSYDDLGEAKAWIAERD